MSPLGNRAGYRRETVDLCGVQKLPGRRKESIDMRFVFFFSVKKCESYGIFLNVETDHRF